MPDIRSAVSDRTWAAADFVAHVASGGGPVRPFSDDSLAFCDTLSAALLTGEHARSLPQLTALGYWLRRASVERMRQAFVASESDRVLLVPRGLVLQITPANVDTMFVYSLVPALLTGNVSVVRVSDRSADATQLLLSTIGNVLARDDFADLRARTHLVHTSHDDAVSATLSAVADVRVVWGGDATVERFRRFPLPPRGRDVTFPDRHSLAILDAQAVCAAGADELAALGEAMFNDAYWFDQGGCSSPRLVLWRAAEGTDVDGARARLRDAVSAAVGRRGYRAEVGTVIEKMVRGLRAASAQDGVRVSAPTNEATWVELPDLDRYDRDTCGGGLFFDVVSYDLTADLAAFVGPKDQTAACFGLDGDEVTSLARALDGRGIDRFVRMGRALEFDPVWDGYDLFQEFVKRVVVDV